MAQLGLQVSEPRTQDAVSLLRNTHTIRESRAASQNENVDGPMESILPAVLGSEGGLFLAHKPTMLS